MRVDLLTALLVLAVPFSGQRGTIDSLSVATRSIETGRSVAMTVRGSNPCGAVEIDPGDGRVVTHPITELPAAVTHTYRQPGSYEIQARGMGNCDGTATAAIRVTGAALPEPTTGRASDTPAREPGRASSQSRFPEEPLSGRGKTATMNPKDHWTHSGVTVREGDIVRVEASGNVAVVPNTPSAGPEGSTRGGVGNPRMPDHPAGALLAKIGEDGPPMFIGAERTFRADRSGLLWLGVNDDYFDDNTGEFRVRISEGRPDEVGTSGSAGRRATGRGAGGDRVTERDVTVRATDQWTDTGIALRAGDVVRLEASGTIRLREDQRDTADPTGSRARVAENAPFSNRPAGALIARIGNGEPIFIGARQRNIRVMEDGNLWLGVNDDHVADNSGEFQVRVSVRPARR